MLFLLLATLLITGYFIYDSMDKWTDPEEAMPRKWKTLLAREVRFYSGLDIDKKHLFEYKVMEFLANCKITPIETKCCSMLPLLTMILKRKVKTVAYLAWSVPVIWKAK